jgi:Protein of unknown function (DUF3159)
VKTEIPVTDQLRSLALEVAPLFGFTVTMALTQRVGTALVVALVLGTCAVGYRLLSGRSPWRPLTALGVAGAGALLVLSSGQAENFFLPVFATHAAVATTVITLVLIGRPPLGLIFGSLGGDGARWRRCGARRRAYAAASLVMAAPPMIMLSVGVPLYIAGEVIALGFVETFNAVLIGLAGLVAFWWVSIAAQAARRPQPPQAHPVGSFAPATPPWRRQRNSSATSASSSPSAEAEPRGYGPDGRSMDSVASEMMSVMARWAAASSPAWTAWATSAWSLMATGSGVVGMRPCVVRPVRTSATTSARAASISLPDAVSRVRWKVMSAAR